MMQYIRKIHLLELVKIDIPERLAFQEIISIYISP